MSFLDQLNEAVEKLNNQGGYNDEKVTSPYSKLKNEPLNFSKETPNFMVRVLPPSDPNKFFTVPIKTMWINTVNKGGKKISMNATLPFSPQPGESPLTEEIQKWANESRSPSLFNPVTYPSKKYLMNVVQVAPDQQGNMQMERDQQGNLVVRLLTLPVSGYQALINKIGDVMYQPEGAGDYGIIGINNAYPIRVSRPQQGGKSYTVDVFEKNLGALPQGWENSLEDLDYQATPDEVYNKEWVDYVISVVNGTEGQDNQDGGQGQGQQQQSFNQQQNNQAQQNQGFNQGGGQQQQPQQQQQFNQAPPQQQQQFNQAPPQQQQQFNQGGQQTPPPVQQQPSFQQGFQQSQQQQAPQQSFNQPVDMEDGDPYPNSFENHMPTDFASKPDVQPQNGFGVQDTAPQPTQGEFATPPTPPTQTQGQATPPQQAINTGGAQNVEDILSQMQNK